MAINIGNKAKYIEHLFEVLYLYQLAEIHRGFGELRHFARRILARLRQFASRILASSGLTLRSLYRFLSSAENCSGNLQLINSIY